MSDNFCQDCASWRFEPNPQFQTEDERDGFGICDRVVQMMDNPIRAIARVDDELAKFQCRAEYGCVLFEAK